MCIYKLCRFACHCKVFWDFPCIFITVGMWLQFFVISYNSRANKHLCYFGSIIWIKRSYLWEYNTMLVAFLSSSLNSSLLSLKHTFILVWWYYPPIMKPSHILCTTCSGCIFTTALLPAKKCSIEVIFLLDKCILITLRILDS